MTPEEGRVLLEKLDLIDESHIEPDIDIGILKRAIEAIIRSLVTRSQES